MEYQTDSKLIISYSYKATEPHVTHYNGDYTMQYCGTITNKFAAILMEQYCVGRDVKPYLLTHSLTNLQTILALIYSPTNSVGAENTRCNVFQ